MIPIVNLDHASAIDGDNDSSPVTASGGEGAGVLNDSKEKRKVGGGAGVRAETTQECQGNKQDELLELTRRLLGLLDRLEESQTELRKDAARRAEGRQVFEDRSVNERVNAILFDSALGRGP
uniref:AlNc14C161G7776 protein n=1 Tax=Albugo laibachii Nc14 TaxID=890382 RepID=F0WMU0_9STRA|nr:AlNc14C161G7776 [Albugo laibachii Nc14]|eukprot:CCA22625.1 AlNc14C161G7776 [Albugo laibachii Nc14]